MYLPVYLIPAVAEQRPCLQVLPVSNRDDTSFVVVDKRSVHLLSATLPPVSLLTLFSRARQKQAEEASQEAQPRAAAQPSLAWLQQLQAAAGSELLAAAVPLSRQVGCCSAPAGCGAIGWPRGGVLAYGMTTAWAMRLNPSLQCEGRDSGLAGCRIARQSAC